MVRKFLRLFSDFFLPKNRKFIQLHFQLLYLFTRRKVRKIVGESWRNRRRRQNGWQITPAMSQFCRNFEKRRKNVGEKLEKYTPGISFKKVSENVLEDVLKMSGKISWEICGKILLLPTGLKFKGSDHSRHFQDIYSGFIRIILEFFSKSSFEKLLCYPECFWKYICIYM